MTKPHTTDLSVELQQISKKVSGITELLHCSVPLLSCLHSIYVNRDELVSIRPLIEIFNLEDLETMLGISNKNILEALHKCIDVEDSLDAIELRNRNVLDDARENTVSRIATHK